MKKFHTSIVLVVLALICQSCFSGSTLGKDCTVKEYDQLNAALERCSSIIIDDLFVPGGKTLDLNLKEGTSVTFKGNTTFGYAPWAGPLVAINGTNVVVQGETGAILDGQGDLYWDGQGEWGTLKPKFFIIQVHNSVLKNIYVLNTPVHCVLLADSSDVDILNWTIDVLAGDEDRASSGKYGHNTDGFDVWNSTNVLLKDSKVYNQDDCVAVRCGENITIDHFYCHGGHGLSISVGFSNDTVSLNTLRSVTFSNSILEGGENGIHIKTHVDGGKGLMEDIAYKNITFFGQKYYGINIQENYQNLPSNSSFPSTPKNNIPICNLNLTDISGNVKGKAVPIYILCADEGCFNWKFTNVCINGTQSSDSCNYLPDGFTC